jgi:hypothetical protein
MTKNADANSTRKQSNCAYRRNIAIQPLRFAGGEDGAADLLHLLRYYSMKHPICQGFFEKNSCKSHKMW